MISPRPSLTASTSVSSISSSSSDEEASKERGVNVRAQRPSQYKTKVNVGSVLVHEKATVPGVLNGTVNNTTLNFLVNSGNLTGDIRPVNVSDLVSDAVKITSETVRSFSPSDNSSSSTKLTGTKEELEGLSRRWCYLITALVILSLITLLSTAVLSLFSWKSSSPTLPPSTQDTVDSLTAEEKHFAAISNGPSIVTRSMWLAAPPKEPLHKNSLPATMVVVCHTAGSNCSSQPECIAQTKATQNFHQNSRLWSDIGFNFLIGGDGSVYWGRGFDFMGAHTKNHNNGTIGVAFIGYYVYVAPSDDQIEAFHKLMNVGVQEGKIASDYTLVVQCQLKVTAAPGLALVHLAQSWPHYNSSLPVLCTEG